MIEYRKEIEPLTPYVPGRPKDDVKKEYGLDYVVKIASNENPLGCSKKVREAVIAALDDASLYPDGNCTALRDAISERFKINANQIFFGAGLDEVIFNIAKAYVPAGSECITAETTFSQYAAASVAMGGKMIYVKMKDHGFDLNEIIKNINDKTKIIFIANPNNPTGTFIPHDELSGFLQKVPANILVVLDEAYAEFVTRGDYPKSLELLKEYPNIMVLRTFSKAYGLASFRVGYAVADAGIVTILEKVRNPFNVSIPAQAAALAALGDTEFLEYSINTNEATRKYTTTELEKLGCECIPSEANFVMADVKRDSRTLFTELMKKGYIIRPGAAFGMDTYLRVSIGTIDEMKGFIKTLGGLLK